MKTLLGLACSLSLVAALPAQSVPTKLVTALDVAVVANDGATTIQNLKKGTDITSSSTNGVKLTCKKSGSWGSSLRVPQCRRQGRGSWKGEIRASRC